MNTLKTQEKNIEQTIDYLKIIKIILSRWYWIATCIILALLFTYLYLWYTPPIYSTTASLKFDDNKNGLSDIIKVNTTYDRTNKIQSETFVIQSREVLLNAIKRLNIKVSYFLKGRVRTTETYPYIPFPINIISQDSTNVYRGLVDLKKIDQKSFELHYGSMRKNGLFDKPIALPGVTFTVSTNDIPLESQYSFKFSTAEDFLPRAMAGLSMREAAKSSNVLLLTIVDKNPVFAADLLNSILASYTSLDGSQKSLSATQTIDFIDRQLAFLAVKVSNSGSALESYKKDKKLINITSNSEQIVQEVSSLEEKQNAFKIQLLAIAQLEDQVKNGQDQLSLNFNMDGSIDALMGNLIQEFNYLIVERQKRLAQFLPDSEPIKQLDQRLQSIKPSILKHIQNSYKNTQRTLQFVENQLAQTNKKLTLLPKSERDLISLQSAFEINQRVYEVLSEKKLEAQINRAAVVPGAIIVDRAGAGSRMVSPVPSKVYTYAVIFGLMAGIGLILLVRLSNPFVHDRETVERLTNTSIIGMIRRFPNFIDKDNSQALSLEKPKSIFAESVRSVRTNLSFLASEQKSKVICITSEISGEGKSFVTINLASTLALIDKKVILVGADLRKSKLHKTFKAENKDGLSKYLSNQNTLSEIILGTPVKNLDFIPAGPVPPNPSELLLSIRMTQLIEELKDQYDFILIDTAPIGLVSDAIPLIRLADINLFVIRAGVSKYSAATIPDRINSEYHLNNMVILLNAFGDEMLHSSFYSSNYSKGYNTYYYSDYNGYSGSGYYIEEHKPRWWEIWKKA